MHGCCLEDGGRDPEPRNVGSLKERGKQVDCPAESPRGSTAQSMPCFLAQCAHVGLWAHRTVGKKSVLFKPLIFSNLLRQQ